MPVKSQSKKSILFIINPASGRKRHKDLQGLITKKVDKSKYEIDIAFSESVEHAKELATEAVDNKTDVVVAVGGDGTINTIASALINSNSTLGIIPTGSGNGLARHIGISLSLPKAFQIINEGHITPIDTATANGHPFVSIAGVGFDALVAEEFANNKKRGLLSYFTIVANNFFNYKPKKYSVRFDNGDTLKTRALFIAFANSSQFGYNTTIAPHAKLTDGLLEVCIVQKPPLIAMPNIANLLFLKRIVESSFVQVISSKELVLERKRNRSVNIDGEPIKLKKKLTIKINPLSLKVITPKYGKKEI